MPQQNFLDYSLPLNMLRLENSETALVNQYEYHEEFKMYY